MRTLLIVCLALLAMPALAQRAPGAPTPAETQAQLVRLQVEIAKNDEARRRIDAELRDLERRAADLRVELQRLQMEQVRLQSELQVLQTR
jgi:septal ring factor EnvC (AmiA/AmiB activator)